MDVAALAPHGLPWLAVRVAAVTPLRRAAGADDRVAPWLGIVLAGRQRRRTERMCPVGQDVRQSDVENSPAGRVSDSVVPRVAMACRASGSLGDRRARRCGRCHKEHTGRTGEEKAQEAQVAYESRAAATRPCLLPR